MILTATSEIMPEFKESTEGISPEDIPAIVGMIHEFMQVVINAGAPAKLIVEITVAAPVEDGP